MINRRVFGPIGLVIIGLATISLLGIAYAAFSQNLTISGQATVSANTWKIGWSSMTKNTGSIDITIPTINSNGSTTSIESWSATLAKPGQYVSFNITAKNYGSFPAKLTGLTNASGTSIIGNPKSVVTCAKTTNGVDADATNVCNNLTLVVKNASVTNSPALTTSNATTLAASTGTETYTVILTYNQNSSDTTGSTLPTAPVTVTVGTMKFVYTQQ